MDVVRIGRQSISDFDQLHQDGPTNDSQNSSNGEKNDSEWR